MKRQSKSKIISLSKKAIKFFISYENTCQEIEKLLGKETKEECLGVLYQKSDGLVVCVNRGGFVADNIPIEDYLQEIKENEL